MNKIEQKIQFPVQPDITPINRQEILAKEFSGELTEENVMEGFLQSVARVDQIIGLGIFGYELRPAIKFYVKNKDDLFSLDSKSISNSFSTLTAGLQQLHDQGSIISYYFRIAGDQFEDAAAYDSIDHPENMVSEEEYYKSMQEDHPEDPLHGLKMFLRLSNNLGKLTEPPVFFKYT